MRGPGPAGWLVVLAFAVPVAVEARTVLSMAGVTPPIAAILAAGVVALAAAVVLARRSALTGDRQTEPGGT